MRMLSRCFVLRSVVAAEDGKPLPALQSVAFGARIAHHAGEKPTLIPGLVQIAIQTIQHRQFIAVLKQYGDQPAVLVAARKTLDAFGRAPELRHNLRGEVAFCALDMEGLVVDPKAGMELLKATPYYSANDGQRRVMANAWQVRLLEFWREAFDLLGPTGTDEAKGYQKFRKLADNEENRWKNDPTYMMNSILMPTYGQAVLKYLQSEAEARLRSTALTLLQERSRTGHFPATLPYKTPTSKDPFDNQSLRYKRIKKGSHNGFLLYSIGANLKDDGGSNVSKSKGSGPADLVVAYP